MQGFLFGKTILEWNRFDIVSQEIVHFSQMQGNAPILYRVTSGSLQSNCPIYLVNPKEVMIGSLTLADRHEGKCTDCIFCARRCKFGVVADLDHSERSESRNPKGG